jgi:hypothetical protein
MAITDKATVKWIGKSMLGGLVVGAGLFFVVSLLLLIFSVSLWQWKIFLYFALGGPVVVLLLWVLLFLQAWGKQR